MAPLRLPVSSALLGRWARGAVRGLTAGVALLPLPSRAGSSVTGNIYIIKFKFNNNKVYNVYSLHWQPKRLNSTIRTFSYG